MNNKLLKGLVPIVLSGVMSDADAASYTLKYNELDMQKSHLSDKSIAEHLEQANKSTYKDFIISQKFYGHLNLWNQKTRFLSSPNAIVEEENFQEILKLGYKALPFIIVELQKEPSYLVWSLNLIFGFKISENPLTTIPEATKMWLKYLKEKKFY